MTVMQDKTIKSAVRVLEVLEMFDENRQSVTVMDVARNLKFPQSSTSELLSCLVKQGYLHHHRSERAYRPTTRVSLLGAWVQPSLFRYGRLLPMMDELSVETGQVVVLGSMIGVALKHLHVVGQVTPSNLRAGTDHHLLHSPLGHALLSTTDGELVRKLTHRLNAESEPGQWVKHEDLASSLDTVRSQGFALQEMDPDMAGIAVLLPQPAGQEQLSLGIFGTKKFVHENQVSLVRNLRGAISRHVGPIVASAHVDIQQRAYRRANYGLLKN